MNQTVTDSMVKRLLNNSKLKFPIAMIVGMRSPSQPLMLMG